MMEKSKSYSEKYPIKRGDSIVSMDSFQGFASPHGSVSGSVAGSWSQRKYPAPAELFGAREEGAVDGNMTVVELAEEPVRFTSPSPPFVLRFENLNYSISRKRKLRTCWGSGGSRNRLQAADDIEHLPSEYESKAVLSDVSGEARDGELLAVLGHSGSGKSTLIDALAHRISKESLKGSVTLNGEPLGGGLLKSISAYVMQDDLLFPMLTVEETLMFSAEFRLPRSQTKAQKQARVQVLLDQLGLRGAAKTIIGDEGHRGVSGGERRRVSIGIDIIHDPILLFLDEPTSGLDSTSAFMVVKVLQRISQTGSIVVLSIHQPSYRILGLLDRLILLAHGEAVFNGSPSRLRPFFAEFGHPIPENENSMEFALDFTRELEASPGGIKPLVDFFKSWRKTASYGEIAENGTGIMSLKEAIGASRARGKLVSANHSGGDDDQAAIPAAANSGKVTNFANPPWVEIAVLMKRSFLNIRRTPELFMMRMTTVIVTGFLLATVFWKLDESPKGVQERLGFFAFAMSTTFYTCADALPIFLQERYIFLRETAYNAYRRSSYVFAHALIFIPQLTILATAFAVTTFWAVGLAGGASGFFFFLFATVAAFWAANSFVTFLSGVVSNLMIAYTIVVALLAYFLLLSGFFINRDRIPPYWIWFHYISLIKYPYEAVLQNEFDNPHACFARGTQVFDGTPMSRLSPQLQLSFLNLLNTTSNIDITPTTCVTRGIDILQSQDITQLSKWNCVYVTLAWGVLFRILFYISLLLGSKNKRH
jgi:ABC-type multidrug transport system ATPase subunit